MAGEWQAGLGWVCRVAPVWLGHWLGGGFGRARPEVWGLERSLSRVRQSSGHRVPRAGQGEVGVWLCLAITFCDSDNKAFGDKKRGSQVFPRGRGI